MVVVVDGGSGGPGRWRPRGREGRWSCGAAGDAARQPERGRGRSCGTPWLLFLHADSRVGDGALRAIERHVRGRTARSRFTSACACPTLISGIASSSGGQRVPGSGCPGLVYGDQGLLIRRAHFSGAGPYPDEPVMEGRDSEPAAQGPGAAGPASGVDLHQPAPVRAGGALAGVGAECAADQPVPWPGRSRTISRRGIPRGCERLLLLPIAGNGAARPPRATLLVFAKAPRPGEVKTRLANDMGPAGSPDFEGAAALYRRMGRLVVDNVAQAPVTLTVLLRSPRCRNRDA